MGEAQLLVVPLSGGVGLSAEQASLSEAGYDALGMAVPDDFGRPGAGIQVLLSAEDSFALVTIAAVHNGSAASIALADPDLWVPKTSSASCGEGVFVDAAADSACAVGAEVSRSATAAGSGLRERPVQGAVRPVIVVVALVLAQHAAACRWLLIRIWSRSSRRKLPTKRSAIAFARGCPHGVLMIRMSVAVKTASKAAVNLVSRSRMRNRNGSRCRRGP